MATIREEFKLEGVDSTKAVPIAEGFSILLDTVEAHVPTSRERSIVITKLQEACYFAMLGTAVKPK